MHASLILLEGPKQLSRITRGSGGYSGCRHSYLTKKQISNAEGRFWRLPRCSASLARFLLYRLFGVIMAHRLRGSHSSSKSSASSKIAMYSAQQTQAQSDLTPSHTKTYDYVPVNADDMEGSKNNIEVTQTDATTQGRCQSPLYIAPDVILYGPMGGLPNLLALYCPLLRLFA
jgi:hypothetical protein